MSNVDVNRVKEYLTHLQDSICDVLEQEDGTGLFREDAWQREEGGGGRSRVLADGTIFESAGINFSHVHGVSLPSSATAHRPELAGRSFQAMGVSLVIHPLNPYVPTTHANVRFFIAEKDEDDEEKDDTQEKPEYPVGKSLARSRKWGLLSEEVFEDSSHYRDSVPIFFIFVPILSISN